MGYLILLFSKVMKSYLLYFASLLVPLLADDYIVDGIKVTSSKYPFIARLQTARGDCTGSLVKYDLILTAKHCFIDEYGDGGPDGNATFNGYNSTTKEEEEFAVNMTLLEPYDNSDLALAKLHSNVWMIKPVKIAIKRVRMGDSVKAVGYGMHGFNKNDGHLRDIDLVVSHVNKTIIGTKVGENNEGPCSGDSEGYNCYNNFTASNDDEWNSVSVINPADLYMRDIFV